MKPHVLAIDDNLADRRLIQRSLEADFDVTCCGSGEEGLALLEMKIEYAVIVADYRLPGISGLEFISRAASIQPDAGRLMITADPTIDRALFPVVMLFKPVKPADLMRFVSQLAGMSKRAKDTRARATRPTDPLLPAVPMVPKGKKAP